MVAECRMGKLCLKNCCTPNFKHSHDQSQRKIQNKLFIDIILCAKHIIYRKHVWRNLLNININLIIAGKTMRIPGGYLNIRKYAMLGKSKRIFIYEMRYSNSFKWIYAHNSRHLRRFSLSRSFALYVHCFYYEMIWCLCACASIMHNIHGRHVWKR